MISAQTMSVRKQPRMVQQLLITILTRGRSGSVGSIWTDEAVFEAFLCSERIDGPLGVAKVWGVPFFLFFDIAEVDIVDSRSLIVTLEASDRESSGWRGRPSCNSGICRDKDTD